MRWDVGAYRPLPTPLYQEKRWLMSGRRDGELLARPNIGA